MTGDSFVDGNALATLRPLGYSRDDFVFFPEDMIIDQTTGEYTGYESGSPTGRYLYMPPRQYLHQFSNLYYGATNSGGYLYFGAGGNVPKTSGTLYVYIACAGTGSGQIQASDTSGGTIATSSALSCTGNSSAYSLQTLRASLSGMADGAIQFHTSGASPIKIAYMQYVPDLGSVNGMAFAPGGAQIPTQPSTATVTNDIVTYDSTTGHQHDSGVSVPATGTLAVVLSGTTVSIGGSALTAGQCVLAPVIVKGAATGMVVAVSPAGAGPGAGFAWQGWVAGSNSVTVSLCAIVAGTPHATTYNYRVIQ
jgi:hypothetical protein